jgi:hypothetical protein
MQHWVPSVPIQCGLIQARTPLPSPIPSDASLRPDIYAFAVVSEANAAIGRKTELELLGFADEIAEYVSLNPAKLRGWSAVTSTRPMTTSAHPWMETSPIESL